MEYWRGITFTTIRYVQIQAKGGCEIMQDWGRASTQGQSRMHIVLKDNYTKVITGNRVNEVAETETNTLL